MSRSNDLTSAVLKFLSHRRFNVWRQNNLAAPGRTFTGRKGVPDVIGFHSNVGTFIGVEIKTGKDKLSLEQVQFGIDTLSSGGFWFVAHDISSFIEEFDSAALWYEIKFEKKQPTRIGGSSLSSTMLVQLEKLRLKLLTDAKHNSTRRNKTNRKGRD